jgi:hypothetical protein
MAIIGKRNVLPVVRETAHGLYLDGGESGEILLPRRHVRQGVAPGDRLDVFVCRDSEDRLVATTETPRAMVGEFACLTVVGVNRQVGAFLDWGLAKDLLLPFREQGSTPVSVGERVVVCVYLDPKTDRIVASARLNRHLSGKTPRYREGQAVSLIIIGKTPLGYNAIVENAHRGLLYHGNIAAPLETGQTLNGFVRAIRPDGKIDLGLDAAGYQRVAPLTEQIIESLKRNGGHLDFDDASAPEAVRQNFGVSKKAFKQALGKLYKERRIRFRNPGIELCEKPAAIPPRARRTR